MANYVRIPVLKNRGVTVTRGKKSKKGFLQFAVILSLFILMLTFVWLKVETNLTLSEIQNLEEKLHENTIQNEKLRAEVVRLSNFSRIQKIAQMKLGLDFIRDENIIEIQKN